MFKFFREKDFSHPFIIWCLFLFWYLLVANSLFDYSRLKIQDFFTSQSLHIFQRYPQQAKNIVIVAIDDASRRNLNIKWRWNNSLQYHLQLRKRR